MTDKYAVIGNPVEHSLSPIIHAEFARQTSQKLTYEKMLAPISGFLEVIDAFRQQGAKGANITLPFKTQAFEYAQQVTERAKLAGAVNTICFQDNGIILGDNTDGIGLVRDLTEYLRWNLTNRRILILGAGGAVAGILGPLLERDPKCVVIMNRSIEKAELLINRFPTYTNLLLKENYLDWLKIPFDLIINSIPSEDGKIKVELPRQLFHPDTQAYDLSYGFRAQAFLSYVKEQGCNQVADGLGMLIEQAAEAFYLWRGIHPNTNPVRELLKSYV